VRKFTSTGTQVAVVAIRPERPLLSLPPPPAPPLADAEKTSEDDAKSEASYDPLFDEPDEDEAGTSGAVPRAANQVRPSTVGTGTINPRGSPPLDLMAYGAYSPDMLMTASMDGSIMLWGRLVDDHECGRGVRRLEGSSKTPLWCISVSRSTDVPLYLHQSRL
jgi:transcriptional activator SPT8